MAPASSVTTVRVGASALDAEVPEAMRSANACSKGRNNWHCLPQSIHLILRATDAAFEYVSFCEAVQACQPPSVGAADLRQQAWFLEAVRDNVAASGQQHIFDLTYFDSKHPVDF